MHKGKTLLADLSWAALLGVVLLATCYLRLWGDAGSAVFGGKIVDATLAQPIAGTKLGRNIALFALAQIALHTLLGLFCMALAQLSRLAWRDQKNSRRTWTTLWFIVIAGWVLVANARWFPTSSLGAPYADAVTLGGGTVDLLTISGVLLAAAVAVTLVRALTRIELAPALLRWAIPVVAVPLITLGVLRQGSVQATTQVDKPNIVIIGLDSLRHDAIQRQPSLTPSIDAFLKDSVSFSDATTPLARTFPSWVSLITGRHPHTTGATVNLLPRHLIDTGETLPQMLGRAGYRSVYAIDEVRFSNLDLSYGFDQMIAPPIGATDFLLAFFSDTPLSNVMMNTRIGALLFPYAHANRAAALTYDPDSFVQRIDRNLDVNGPTLLAIHLTLAHWPYTWGGNTDLNTDNPKVARPLYEKAVSRVDRQFAAVMGVLQGHGVLENALVFVLSDHGEDLSGDHDDDSGSILDPRFDPAKILGHGTSVFSKHQYHVVLAARTFGKTSLKLTPGSVLSHPVSLEDVTPTIADFLSLQSSQPFDGRSLLPLMGEGAATDASVATRIRFTETEFNPPGLTLGTFATPSALRTAASFYRVDPETDRVLLREDDLDIVLAKRQYAAFRDSRMVVALPSADSGVAGLELRAVNPDGTPPTLLTPAMLAADPGTRELWEALQGKFPALAARVQLEADPTAGAPPRP